MKILYFVLPLGLWVMNDASSMIRALNTAANGMASQETEVNTISNNIANLNTNGFKKGRAETEDLLYQTIEEAGGRTSADTVKNVGVQIGTGSRVSAVKRNFAQGDPKMTNNPFDLMINGPGFFAITLPNGQLRYTRDGAFSVNSNGIIVNRNGYPLAPGFNIPPGTKSVNITDDGTVEVFFTNQVEPQNLGQVPVFTFINPPGLQGEGGNLYRPSTASGVPIQNIAGQSNAGSIQQGALESSNVNIMVEMTDLIRAQRAYEMNSKVMGVADKMLQTVNSLK
ncbi:MAG: flagellar basal-body rod protein FlgG [Bacteriovoracaceae bacterium]